MARAMSYHTRTSLLVHYVFSTKNRLPTIPVAIQPRLWSYVGGIARANSMKALAVGGMSDHMHALLSLSPRMSIAKAIQLVEAGSSKWMHDQQGTRFEWQVGYGGFTIGISQVKATVDYILNQEKHHGKKSSPKNGRCSWTDTGSLTKRIDCQSSLTGLRLV